MTQAATGQLCYPLIQFQMNRERYTVVLLISPELTADFDYRACERIIQYTHTGYVM